MSSDDDDLHSERYGADEASSEVEPSSSEADSEPVSEKRISARKPSKKVLETAMNEVSPIDD